MSVEPSDDTPLDPTAERVADFVSAEVGSPAWAKSSEREFVRRLARFRQLRRTRSRIAVGVTVASTLVVVGLAGSRFRDAVPTAPALSYRVDSQDPPSGGYILASQTADALLAFSDGSKVRMAARARGRVVEVNNRGAKFSLDDGKVSVDIVHRPRAQWIFEAGPFRVNVHGTSFTVAWNPVEAVFEVRLASGAISVASPVAGPEIQMRAGQTLRVSLRDQSSSLGKLGNLATMSSPRGPIGRRTTPADPCLRATADGSSRAVRGAAMVAPRLDDRARGEQSGRRRRRRGPPGSGDGARAGRQRGPLGAGQCRQICRPVFAGAGRL